MIRKLTQKQINWISKQIEYEMVNADFESNEVTFQFLAELKAALRA